jgi:F0F1-type ATP synthase assembly protein I
MADTDKNPSGSDPERADEDDLDEVGEAIEGVEMPPHVRLPDVPSLPTLPEAPTLKPNLPKLAKPSKTAEEARQMGIAYTLPAMLIAPIVLLTLVGYWLDGHYNKSPLFTLSGALLGAVSGMINMMRAANKLNK